MKFYIVEQCKRNGESYKVRRFMGSSYIYHAVSGTCRATPDKATARAQAARCSGPHTYVIRTLTMEEAAT